MRGVGGRGWKEDDSGVRKGGELEELGIGGGIRGRATLEREARQFARVENISYLYASTTIKQ